MCDTFSHTHVVRGRRNRSDLCGALATLQKIEAAGGVALLMRGPDGKPTSINDPAPAPDNNAVVDIVAPMLATSAAGVAVAPGATVTWDAAGPTTPAAAVALCIPDASTNRIADLDVAFGIDKQVVADQINAKLGPLGSVGAGSINAGAVGSLATLAGE